MLEKVINEEFVDNGDTNLQPQMKEKSRPRITSKASFCKDFIPPDYIIDGILQRRFIYSLTGQTGHAKTAVALLIAELVGSATEDVALGGHNVEKGRVFYFVGENADDVCMRIIGADSQRHDNPGTDNLYFIPGVFDIGQMFDAISEDMRGLPADLVIVDTSAAYFLGDEELSNTQMGQHAQMLRRLTTLPGGPCVLVLCHPTKHVTHSSQLLPRGGGRFLTEIDGNLTNWKRDDGLVELHHTTKFRGPGFEPILFKLEKITTTKLQDTKGRLLPTVRAVPIGEVEEKSREDETRSDEDRLLIALLHNSNRSWADLARALKWTLANGEPYRSRVQRTLDRLEKAKLIRSNRGKATLTKSGEQAAKDAAAIAIEGGQNGGKND